METWIGTIERIARVLSAALPPEEARLEAYRVASGVTGRPLEELLLRGPCSRIPEPELASLRAALARIARGEPSAYVVGRVPFHDIEVGVDHRALIPRCETEVLVEAVVQWCSERRMCAPRILDLGTGTGCIAMALAAALPSAQVVATDVCRDALDLASENLRRFPWRARVRLVCGDWLRWTASSWDVIVSNPPYVATSEWECLPSSVRDWEPRSALDGGPDGCVFLDELVDRGLHHLSPDGLLALELRPDRAQALLARARSRGYEEAWLVRDRAGRQRILMATKGGA